MTTELRRAFDAARAGSEERSYIFGLLGKPDGTVAVSGQPGYLYVRVSNEADRTLTTARNPYAVPQRANLPVKMRRERGQLVIVSIDASRLYDATTTGDTVNPYGVAKHTHLLGTGLEYTVEALRLEPGQLYPAGGLLAGVRAFRYYYSGGWVTFEGDTISLGTYRPATVGHHAWVLVGVDPATNTIVAVAGTSQIYATPLTIDQIDSITFTGYIPVGAVKVRNDDTEVTDITKYQDAHEWFGVPVGGVNFLDAEGNPADVASAAVDGASVYAARRDHVHTVAAATVTNAMRANMAEATVSGRAAGAGTGVPTDLSAAQLVTIIATADGAGSTLDADTLDGLSSLAFVKADGTVPLTATWDTGASTVRMRRIDARDSNGLIVVDDAANYGIFLKDGGNVGIGAAVADNKLDVTGSDAVVAIRVKSSNNIANFIMERPDSNGSCSLNFRDTDFGDQFVMGVGVSGNNDLWEITTGGGTPIVQVTNSSFRMTVAGSLTVDGDSGGVANTTTFTDGTDVSAASTGVGTVKLKGASNRDCNMFIKIFVGTTAYWVPGWSVITG